MGIYNGHADINFTIPLARDLHKTINTGLKSGDRTKPDLKSYKTVKNVKNRTKPDIVQTLVSTVSAQCSAN